MLDPNAMIEVIPPPPNLTEGIVDLAAAARQATNDDEGSKFVVAHILRMIRAVQALEAENAALRSQIP